MSMLSTLLAFLVTLGVLIVVHEYGHYRVAVACGVKVLRFSVGFGHVLYRWKPRRQRPGQDTEFVIGAFGVLLGPTSQGPVTAGARPFSLGHCGLWSGIDVGGSWWDPVGQVPWFSFWDAGSGGYRQGYYDDPTSLRIKYDMVLKHNLAGIGIWHLGMDTGVPDLWNVIEDEKNPRTLRADAWHYLDWTIPQRTGVRIAHGPFQE